MESRVQDMWTREQNADSVLGVEVMRRSVFKSTNSCIGSSHLHFRHFAPDVVGPLAGERTAGARVGVGAR